MFQLHCLIGLAFSLSLFGGFVYAEDPKPTAEMIALIETVKAGLKKNDERLGHLEINLKSTLISPDVKVAKRITNTWPDGTRVSCDVAPKFENRIKVIQEDEKIRHVLKKMDGEIKQIIVFDGKLWTQFTPEIGRAWIRTPEQSPHYTRLYPNSFGVGSTKPSVSDVLEKGELLSARRERQKDGSELIAAQFRFAPSVHTYLEFDSKANYLPVTIGQFDPDDKTFGNLTFRTHQQIEGKEAWFLKNADTYFLKVRTKQVKVPESFRQKSSLRVNSIKVLDPKKEPKENAPFEIDLPIGVTVDDIPNRRRYQKGGPRDPNLP